MNKESCPICEHTICEEFVVDLMICSNCSHVFKKKTELEKDKKEVGLHLYNNPIDTVREITDKMEDSQVIEFNFPSMNFYALDLHPTDFYKSSINHYFNQMSLMILLRRCRLKPIKQENKWNKDETMCITNIICRRI